MTRFSATALDLSNVDRAELWPARSFEAIRTARLADLKSRLEAAGVPFDVETLESDPGVILQEVSGYRELLTLQAIDDAQAKVLLCFAWGRWLDRLGDLQGCARMPGETDQRYRTRVQLAVEAYPCTGTPGGYIYHAMSVDLAVRDCSVSVLRPHTYDVMVEMVILSTGEPGVPTPALMHAVRDRVLSDEIKLATDTVVCRPAVLIPYDVAATIYLRPGPDPGTAQRLALAAVRSTADRYKRIGSGIPANVLAAACYVSNVDRVVLEAPAADIAVARYQAAYLRSVEITTAVIDE